MSNEAVKPILRTPAVWLAPMKAEWLASVLRKGDPEWDYKVKHEPFGKSFVQIYDEDGMFLGHV